MTILSRNRPTRRPRRPSEPPAQQPPPRPPAPPAPEPEPLPELPPLADDATPLDRAARSCAWLLSWLDYPAGVVAEAAAVVRRDGDTARCVGLSHRDRAALGDVVALRLGRVLRA